MEAFYPHFVPVGLCRKQFSFSSLFHFPFPRILTKHKRHQ